MENNIMNKRKRDIGKIVAIAAILFTNLVIENALYIKYVYGILITTLVYAFYLILKKPQILKKMFSSYFSLWIIMFAVEMFIYGYFGERKSEYSLSFHILHLVWIFILFIILAHDMENTKDLIAQASAVVIFMMTVYIVLTSSFNLGMIMKNGGTTRIGDTAVGNVNTTAISYIFLLIPIIYKISIDKEKRYIPIALLGIAFMFLTGSKKGIIFIAISAFIIAFGKTSNKNKLLKSIFKVSILILILASLCYYNSFLNNLIWKRLESFIITLNNFNPDDQSSTNLRMNFIITAFSKAWDKPIFGHGWGAFAMMYGYSSLYKTNLYTHNNYAEILFSFGLLGFLIYYWFPCRAILKTVNTKNNNIKIFCWLYIINILVIDFGTVSCYSSILGFLSFLLVSLAVYKEENDEEKKKIIEKNDFVGVK